MSSSEPLRIAVVGSGIAGLAAAHALADEAQVTLFEAQSHFGGHANTVDVELDGIRHGVDTGFLVFNHRTYPGLTALFESLGVRTAPSSMTFSVQARTARGRLEWSGANPDTVFCQRGNLLRPRFWRMLRDLMRFNALATRIAQSGADAALAQPLGSFLREQGFSDEFRDWYLLPMTACIWSMSTQAMLAYPAGTLIRFCHNHGLLQVTNRPQWYTVEGGSRHYVSRMVERIADRRLATPVRRIARTGGGVRLTTDGGVAHFDRLVLATHAPQALALLEDSTLDERRVLGAIRTQANRAVLHTDESVLPRSRKAWSAWNYEAAPDATDPRVCLHYLINELQPLPWKRSVIVSLNPLRPPDPARVLDEFDYDHPVLDTRAVQAQLELPLLQGRRNTWFCGAWTGYGFHEDGLASGLAAARLVLTQHRIRAVETAA